VFVADADMSLKDRLRGQRRCQQCQGSIPATDRSDARFCSTACRQRAYRERGRATILTSSSVTRPRPAVTTTVPAGWSDFDPDTAPDRDLWHRLR